MDGFEHIGVEKSLSSVEIFLFLGAVVNLLVMTGREPRLAVDSIYGAYIRNEH